MRLILLTILALAISIEAAPASERAKVWKPKAAREAEQLKVKEGTGVPTSSAEAMEALASNLEVPRSHIRRTKVAAVTKETVDEVPTDVESNTLTTEASIKTAAAPTEESTTQSGSRIRAILRGDLQRTNKTPGRRISTVRGSQTAEPTPVENTATTSRPRRIETTTVSETSRVTQVLATRKISRGRQTTTTAIPVQTTTTTEPVVETTTEPKIETTTTEQVVVEPSTIPSVETPTTADEQQTVAEAEVEVTTTTTEAQPEVAPNAEQPSVEQEEEVTTTTTTTTTEQPTTTTTEEAISTTDAAKVTRVVAKEKKTRKPVVRVEKRRPVSSSSQQTTAQPLDEEVVVMPSFNPVKL